MKNRMILFSVLLTLPVLAAANFECKRYPFLKNGFDFHAYQRCHELIRQCPLKGVLPDAQCVKRITKKNKICMQINKLSTTIKGDPGNVTAEQVENFTLITQAFIADGQFSYYIIAPNGCLVNTKIDPRKLNVPLKKKYKNTPFIITNSTKPQFTTASDGAKVFTSSLRVTKTCLACDAIGTAKVQFIFDKNGKLKNIDLQSFGK